VSLQQFPPPISPYSNYLRFYLYLYYFLRHYCRRPQSILVHGSAECSPPSTPIRHQRPSWKVATDPPFSSPICSAITGIRGRHQCAPPPHDVAWKVSTTPIRPHPPPVMEGCRGSPTLLPLCSMITGIRGCHQRAPAPRRSSLSSHALGRLELRCGRPPLTHSAAGRRRACGSGPALDSPSRCFAVSCFLLAAFGAYTRCTSVQSSNVLLERRAGSKGCSCR
jgi:hypothetical protein